MQLGIREVIRFVCLVPAAACVIILEFMPPTGADLTLWKIVGTCLAVYFALAIEASVHYTRSVGVALVRLSRILQGKEE